MATAENQERRAFLQTSEAQSIPSCEIEKRFPTELPETSGSRYYKIQSPSEQRRVKAVVEKFLQR